MQKLNIANRISQNYSLLSKNEKKIADYVINQQETVIQLTIQEFAALVGTSNSTITRFCYKLNYRSFAEFKSILRQEQIEEPVAANVISRVAQHYNQLVYSSAQLIDVKVINELVESLKKASKILVCGLGSSGLTAIELKYRLMRMALPIDAVTDPHMMLMHSALLTKDDILICISNSGEVAAAIDAATLARKSGVKVFSITSRNHTRLTQNSDYSLFTSSVKSVLDKTFINSQLPINFILDMICCQLLEDPSCAGARQKTLNAINAGNI